MPPAAVAAARTRITTRWTSGGPSGPGATGRRCRSGSRGRSPTAGSTSCSRRCRRTGTGRWSRSGSPPGPGPSELLGMRQCDFRPGEQLISVVRKGTRAVQQLPASADAFVWHRLYQQELLRLGVPRGRRQPAWWTLRRPYRPLSYHGAHRMFERVNASLGADWTLHDLRHSAASRMARDNAAQPDRRAVGDGSCPSDHDGNLPDAHPGRGDRGRARPPRPPVPGARRHRRRSRRRAMTRSRCRCCSGGRHDGHREAHGPQQAGHRGHRDSGAAAQQPAAQAVPAQARPGTVAGHGPGRGRGAAAADLAAVPRRR